MGLIKKPIVLILLLALILRLFISSWSLNFRDNTDVLRWRDWARIAHIYGFADTYKPDHLLFGTLPNNVPPGEVYIISGMYELSVSSDKVIFKITHQTPDQLNEFSNKLLNMYLRFPSILADLIIGLFMYLFLKKEKKEKAGLIASSLFLFNPVIFYNSSFWGQTDSVITVFFLISLYFLYKDKPIVSSLFFVLSLFIKLSYLYGLPFFFLILFLRKKQIQKNIIAVVVSIVVVLLLTTPVSLKPIAWYQNFFANNTFGEMKNITAFAFNFWWFALKPKIEVGAPTTAFNFSEIQLINSPLSNQTLWHIPLFIIGGLLFGITTLPLIPKILKTKIFKLTPFLIIFSLVSLTAFLFLPQMHERYLYGFFPLLALLGGIGKKFIPYYIFFSLLNFLNLYLVWHPVLNPSLPYQLINNQIFQWSLSAGIVITGFFFYKASLLETYEAK